MFLTHLPVIDDSPDHPSTEKKNNEFEACRHVPGEPSPASQDKPSNQNAKRTQMKQ